ncbi:MAG: hypothetical protein K8R34_05645, partial [Methanosarcinales archaeon]|nr:hypothetical protein [Methanosarcinales archaeon]
FIGWFVIFVRIINHNSNNQSISKIADLLFISQQHFQPSETKNKLNVSTPYSKKTDEEMEGTVNGVINVLAVLAGVYGIMFALIISDKASLVFVSWSFLIWCCWVLAILIRICHCCAILMSDYHQWDRKKKEMILFGIAKFTKHAGYLLIPTASLVPIFSTLENVDMDKIADIYPWGLEISLFVGISSLALLTIIIYTFVIGIEELVKSYYTSIYLYVITGLWLIGIVSIFNSPLSSVTSPWIGRYFFDLNLPSAVVLFEYIFVYFYGYMVGSMLLAGYVLEIIHKCYRKWLN